MNLGWVRVLGWIAIAHGLSHAVLPLRAAARPIFKLHGHEDRLQIEHPDCEHDFPVEMRQRAYKLFDEALK